MIVVSFRDRLDVAWSNAVAMTFGNSGELILEDADGRAIRAYAAGHWAGATRRSESPDVDVDAEVRRDIRGS
jgi:hypothetical protein